MALDTLRVMSEGGLAIYIVFSYFISHRRTVVSVPCRSFQTVYPWFAASRLFPTVEPAEHGREYKEKSRDKGNYTMSGQL